MPGYLVQQGATVLCTHGGQALPTAPSPSVLADGALATIITAPWTVGGCPGVPAASVPPCVSAQWVTGTTRVTSYGQPLVIDTGQAVCAPNGTPLLPVATQVRVAAT